MSRSSHEPTAAVKPATRGRGDTPPPTPPHELPRDAQVEHRFTHEGRSWLARLSGKGACGTGSYGLALVEAVHFFDPAEPDRPLREALMPCCDFEALFEAELIRLLAQSRPIATRAE